MLEQMFRTGDGSGGAKRGHGEHQAAFQFADGGVMRSWGSPLPSMAAHSAVERNCSRGRFSSRAALSASWAQVARLANSIPTTSTVPPRLIKPCATVLAAPPSSPRHPPRIHPGRVLVYVP